MDISDSNSSDEESADGLGFGNRFQSSFYDDSNSQGNFVFTFLKLQLNLALTEINLLTL